MPPSERIVRQRLVAILVADAAGYSRLMALDDRATVRALDVARQVFRDRATAQDGRIVDMAGDSVLAVFDTAIGALKTALEVQEILASADVSVTPDERMWFRIGVHLGDVIQKEDGTVYGDGVNIAARLEALAEPGGIAVSQSIESSINHRLNVRFVDIGAQQVKNITHPIRAFRCEPAELEAATGSRLPKHRIPATARQRRVRFAGFAVLVGLIAGVMLLASKTTFILSGAPGADRRMSVAVVDLVTPVDDALAAEIARATGPEIFRPIYLGQHRNSQWISELPKTVPLVAATADPKEVGRVLKVHFLLRRAVAVEPPGYRVDVTLIDTATNQLLDTQAVAIPPGRKLPKRTADVRELVAKLTFSALVAEVERVRGATVEKLDARDLAMRAFVDWQLANDRGQDSKTAYDAASALLNRALAVAPNDPSALYVTVLVNLCACVSSWSKDVREQERIGSNALDRYLRLQPRNESMLLAKSGLERRKGNLEEALRLVEIVLELDPKDRAALILKTSLLVELGRLDKALEISNRQMQIEEDDGRVIALASAVRFRRSDYLESALLARAAIRSLAPPQASDPSFGSPALTLVAAEALRGNRERAADALRDFRTLAPQLTTVGAIRAWLPADADLADHEPLYKGLRLAGLPE